MKHNAENKLKTCGEKIESIGILGFGEIGQAIAKFYKKPKIKDLHRDDDLMGVEVLHICIPFSDKFVQIVKEEIKKIKPGLTIIHSTVAPGTTQKIGGAVVHSPVRGVHPHLFLGIKTFIKYIGADNKKVGELAEKHFKSLGVKTKIFMPSATTEIGKILDTSYYGVCIAWHGEMKRMCDKFGIDFKEAVSDFNQTYNEGYKKLGKQNVLRPVLYPPEGGIGGHCVVPNAEIMKKYFSSVALDLILKYKK